VILNLLSRKDDFIFQILLLKLKFITSPKSNKVNSAKTYSTISQQKSRLSSMPSLLTVNMPNMKSFEEYIPYSSIVDKSMIFTKTYRFITTFEVEGVCWEAEDENVLNHNQDKIHGIIQALGDKNISFYVHSIRKKISSKLDHEYASEYLTNFSNAYDKAFNDSSLYNNTYYITLIYSPYLGKISTNAFRQLNTTARELEIKQYVGKFKEILSRFSAMMSVFNISELSTYKENNIEYSKQLEFYEYLMSGTNQKVAVLDAPIYTYLTGGLRDIQIGDNTGLLTDVRGNTKFFKILEIKGYPNPTKIGLLNALMYLDIEYTITQSYTPIQKNTAKNSIKRKRGQLVQAEDDGETEIKEIPIVLDSITIGETDLGKYYFSIMFFAPSKKEIVEKESLMYSALETIGIKAATSNYALAPTYFSQYPTNFSYRGRVAEITSRNFADFLSLHNFPKGRKHKNPWGDAILPLKTPSKQAYYLSIHKKKNEDDFGEHYLANFLVFGESGGGKTAFLMLLLNMLIKFNDKKTFPKDVSDTYKKATYIFLDKDRGAIGNILALGGKYIEIDSGVPTGFNPFMCENTEENIIHLQALVKLLVTGKDDPRLDTVEIDNLNKAVKTIMRFPRKKRYRPITLLTQLITEEISDNDSLKKRLKQWTYGNNYGWVFDNKEDNFDFTDEYNVYAIDGTNFLDDENVKDTICYYVFWKTLNLADGRRFGLIGDEAHAWLENPVVRKAVYNKEKTIRKENGFLGFATQSIPDIVENKIARTLIEQAASIFFFPNRKGREDDYVNHLSCTPEEFKTIKGFKSFKYDFLVKNDTEKIIVSADMSDMPKEYLKILSTSLAYVDDVKRIFSKKNISHDEKVKNLINFYKGEDEK
jgi:type IV secretion system protein VirB4